MLLHDFKNYAHVVVLVQNWSLFGAEVLKLLGDVCAQDLMQRCVSVFAAGVMRHCVMACWHCVQDKHFKFVADGRGELFQHLWVQVAVGCF
jgi:hypothetical protein